MTARCALCGVTAPAQTHEHALSGARWVQPPPGWWVLLEAAQPHLRCPRCLRAPKDETPEAEAPGE